MFEACPSPLFGSKRLPSIVHQEHSAVLATLGAELVTAVTWRSSTCDLLSEWPEHGNAEPGELKCSPSHGVQLLVALSEHAHCSQGCLGWDSKKHQIFPMAVLPLPPSPCGVSLPLAQRFLLQGGALPAHAGLPVSPTMCHLRFRDVLPCPCAASSFLEHQLSASRKACRWAVRSA